MSARQRTVLLLFSHQLELSGCVDAIRARTYVPFRAERIGIGPRNARQRTAHLLEDVEDHAIVLALGSAGWLIPRTPPNVPVWAREIKSESGRERRPTLGLGIEQIKSWGWANARLVTVSRPVTDQERAVALASRVGVEMVDMESSAVLAECMDRQVPCGVLRSVTDYATADAPRRYRERVPDAMRSLGSGVAQLVEYLHEQEVQRLQGPDR